MIIVVNMTVGKLDDFVVFYETASGSFTKMGAITEKKPMLRDSWKTISKTC